MFVDNVVLAGVVTAGLMVAFPGGFGYFIWQDARKRSGDPAGVAEVALTAERERKAPKRRL